MTAVGVYVYCAASARDPTFDLRSLAFQTPTKSLGPQSPGELWTQ